MYSLLDKSVTGADVYGIKMGYDLKTTFEQREQIIIDIINSGKHSITLAEIQKYCRYKQRFSAKRLAKRIA